MMGNNGYTTTTRGGCTTKRLLCCFCLGIVSIALFIGLIFLALYIFVHPELPQFQVDSFSLKNFTALSNDSNSKVSFSADISINARNPNKKLDVSFPRSDAKIYYKTRFVAGTNIDSFSMATKNNTQLNSSFTADAADVGDINNVNVASFELWLFTSMKYSGFGSKSNRYDIMKVFCGDLSVGLPTSDGKPGGLTGGPKKCRVGLSKKQAKDPKF